MKIVKITVRTKEPDHNGMWRVFVKVRSGKEYHYGVLKYPTEKKAESVKNGDWVDKNLFSKRT